MVKSLFDLQELVKGWVIRLEYTALNGNPYEEKVCPFRKRAVFMVQCSAYVRGYSVQNSFGEEIFREEFKKGPFVIPPRGGNVEVDVGNLTFDGVSVREILDWKPKIGIRQITDPWEPQW